MVATLLHELAHSITPHALVKGVVLEHSKKASRKWRFEDHGAAFYANFARILAVAELEGIFVINGSDKFSARSLKRFDAIDCGSAVFEDIAKTPSLDNIEHVDAKQRTSLRVVVSFSAKGKTQEKLITVPFPLTDTITITNAAKKALNAKGKLMLVNMSDGSTVNIDTVVDDARLMLVKAK
jgi:hypothetical protein